MAHWVRYLPPSLTIWPTRWKESDSHNLSSDLCMHDVAQVPIKTLKQKWNRNKKLLCLHHPILLQRISNSKKVANGSVLWIFSVDITKYRCVTLPAFCFKTRWASVVFLPSLPKCWLYRCVPPCPIGTWLLQSFSSALFFLALSRTHILVWDLEGMCKIQCAWILVLLSHWDLWAAGGLCD